MKKTLIIGTLLIILFSVVVHAQTEPRLYIARITQSGQQAPDADVKMNTLGGTVVWTRLSAGVYKGTLKGAFPLDSTLCFGTRMWFNGGASDGKSAFLFTNSSQAPDSVILTTQVVDLIGVSVFESDSLLTDADVLPIEIRVY